MPVLFSQTCLEAYSWKRTDSTDSGFNTSFAGNNMKKHGLKINIFSDGIVLFIDVKCC